MLELTVQDGENGAVKLQFEHSLLSLSKWESRKKTPFMSTAQKEASDLIDYFQDMLLNEVDPNLIYRLSPEQLEDLSNYMNDNPTASTVPDNDEKGTPEVVTSELIYYWMTALQINWAAESWHLNRLMTLIRITNYKSQPEKPKSQAEKYADWQRINEENQRRFGEEA